MRERRQRHPLEQARVVAAAVTAAIVCVLLYLADRPCKGQFASSSQIDPLKGSLTDYWSVFGALSATEVSMKQADNGVVEIDVLANSPSWSDVSSGVSYTVGLVSLDWYEFAGEFRADANDAKGIGAQLELHSGRWRFIAKAESGREGIWKKFDVYLRPSSSDPSAEILCRFWGAGGERAGRAFFRNMRLVKIAAPPPTAAQFDLEKKEEARLGNSRHLRTASFGGVGATVLFIAMIVGISWRLLE